MIMRAFIQTAVQLPWEKLLWGGGAIAAGAAATTQSKEKLERPGCTAADAAIQTRGYLDELAKGMGGYGVLKLAKSQMETGANGADQMERTALADKMRDVANALPNVHTKADASSLSAQMDSIVTETWRLGHLCGLKRSVTRE